MNDKYQRLRIFLDWLIRQCPGGHQTRSWGFSAIYFCILFELINSLLRITNFNEILWLCFRKLLKNICICTAVRNLTLPTTLETSNSSKLILPTPNLKTLNRSLVL